MNNTCKKLRFMGIVGKRCRTYIGLRIRVGQADNLPQ